MFTTFHVIFLPKRSRSFSSLRLESKPGLSSPPDFTASYFSEDLRAHLISPNSCFVTTRPEWARSSRRNQSGSRGTETGAGGGGGDTWTEPNGPRRRGIQNLWHSTDRLCSQKLEEERGRNKTINMSSAPGNVGYRGNTGQSQTSGPFHNNSKQTHAPPLLAPRWYEGRPVPDRGRLSLRCWPVPGCVEGRGREKREQLLFVAAVEMGEQHECLPAVGQSCRMGGVLFFSSGSDEPAGPPWELAEVLVHNQLQDVLNNRAAPVYFL